MATLNIRKMKEEDKPFILEMSTRFTDFDFMGWRNREKMKEAQLKMAQEAINEEDLDSDIFVVEDGDENLVGFLHMTKHIDYFTGEQQGYISSLAVSKAGEGKGIAKKLMNKAEEWTRSKGYKQLTLNVFASNERAVSLYKKYQFENEIVKMVKELE